MNEQTVNGPVNAAGWRHRLTRLGQLGFLFFFLKGLVWLGLLAGAWMAS
jgi:hypothetical protein